MLFANLEVNRKFRFRGQPEVYLKSSPDHFREANAGIHTCCVPISSMSKGKLEEIDVCHEFITNDHGARQRKA